MEYRILGRTGIRVSRMCFGALTIGPLQADLTVKEGAAVIRRALELGVNFIDTADLYGTYPYIKEALKGFTGQVIISSKSYDYTWKDMELSVAKALREIGRPYIDIFMLHEQESELTLKGHRPALEYLIKAKEEGIIRAVGVSTHTVAAAMAVAGMDEIDVLHPMINIDGLGIVDGTVEDMLAAIRCARKAGKGIYGMKPLGGGNLIHRAREAFEFVLGLEELDSIALGMKSIPEVEMNVKIFSGEKIPTSLKDRVKLETRKLHIDYWCEACGKCIERCPSKALTFKEGKAAVEHGKCVLCGYCGAVCPHFCIKII